jgi:hypothetical protein
MAPPHLEAKWNKWLEQHACPHTAQFTTTGGKDICVRCGFRVLHASNVRFFVGLRAVLFFEGAEGVWGLCVVLGF